VKCHVFGGPYRRKKMRPRLAGPNQTVELGACILWLHMDRYTGIA
jgi:hypothetical protein